MLIPNSQSVGEMSEGLSVVPEATYNLRVHKAEYVPVPKGKDAKGPYIKAQLVITGPSIPENEKYIGRFVFQNYSMTGEGSFRLREMLSVTGHDENFKLTDDQELVGLEFGAAVAIQKGTGGYQDKNEVKKHLPLL